MNLDVNGMGEGARDGRGVSGREIMGGHCNP